MDEKTMKAIFQGLYETIMDYEAKIKFLIGQVGWSEEGTYTFPDGSTWSRF